MRPALVRQKQLAHEVRELAVVSELSTRAVRYSALKSELEAEIPAGSLEMKVRRKAPHPDLRGRRYQRQGTKV